MTSASFGPRWLAYALATLAGAAPLAAFGDPTLWAIDGAQSQARFRVRLFGLLPLSGRFEDFRGTVHVDAEADAARVDATLAAGSVRMRNPRHADWVRSPEFFDAARHPAIRFVSDAFPLALLATGGEFAGAITLRGVTRPVRFAVEPRRCALAAAPAPTCELDVAGSIERSAFGMASRRGVLSDVVSLRFRIVARPAS